MLLKNIHSFFLFCFVFLLSFVHVVVLDVETALENAKLVILELLEL